MASLEYDVIVIGAGPAGENVAARTVKGGLRTAIVESELVGGECSYWACIPSKALLRPLEVWKAARSIAGAREAVTSKPDAEAILARRDSFTNDWHDSGQVDWLRGAGIDLVRGHGHIIGDRCVSVRASDGTTAELTARHAVAVCTGTGAAIPPIPGLKQARPWTSREATAAKEAPRRLVVVGGGVVACEMATAWLQLGTEEVTMLLRGQSLLPRYEECAREAVRKSLVKLGAKVLTGTSASGVERLGDGSLRVSLSMGEPIEADQILVATGREPRTEDLGLESIGLKPGSWFEVDETMRVNGIAGGWLYAVGDVNHRALLTHMGKYQARICGEAICARATGRFDSQAIGKWSRVAASADHYAVPQVVFTDPEVAAVGLSADEARKRGWNVRVVDYDIGKVAGAGLYADDYEGCARMVVDNERNVVVGMTLVGPAVGEMIHAATIAVAGEVPIDRLRHAVPSFPTISEVWLRLLEALDAELICPT
jgi:pyruvate/2-oxoglutarate dehydrogenase complex dihydrolipoamide dehydrogenase (E3) component